MPMRLRRAKKAKNYSKEGMVKEISTDITSCEDALEAT
jgi:hypothetical protein